MWKGVLLLSGACLALANCASDPDDVEAQYVSPMTYAQYDCDQISMEMSRINREVATVTGDQEDAATRDAVATGVGVVLFWPALFFLAGSDHSDELGRLKGEQEALETAAIQKKCDYAPQIIEAQQKRQEEAEKRAAEERKKRSEYYD